MSRVPIFFDSSSLSQPQIIIGVVLIVVISAAIWAIIERRWPWEPRK